MYLYRLYCVHGNWPHPQVVVYEGEILMQHVHDDVIITLLRTSIPDSQRQGYIKERPSVVVPSDQQKGRSFNQLVMGGGNFPKVKCVCMCVNMYIVHEILCS